MLKTRLSLPLLISLFFLGIFLIPVIYLVYGSVFFQVGGQTLTLSNFLQVLTSPRTTTLLMNTLIIALGAALVSTLLGAVYAWITVRTDVPGKRLLRLIAILPLTMPFLVKAFAWMYLLSPSIGMINVAFQQIFNSTFVLFNIYTLEGIIFAMGVGGIPLAYLTIEPAMKSMDPGLEEASRVAGNGILKTIFKVTIPTLLPAILSAFLLLTIISLENFDYPFMLGSVGRIRTLATEIYFWINSSLPPNYGKAAIIAMFFLIITFSAVTIYIWVTRKAHKFVVVTGKAPRPTVHKLRKWRYVAFAICFSMVFFAYILPFSTLILMSFTSFITYTGQGIFVKFIGFANYQDALNIPYFYNAVTNTIFMAILAAISATLIAAMLSYAALKSRVKGARLIEYISSIPLAFPGIVYGLALFWTFLLLPGISTLLYGTIAPMVIALIFIRLPYSVRMVSGNLIQIGNEMEESSRITGASWLTSFRRIVLPLVKRGLANSFVYTFINSLRELSAVILLITPQSFVLTVLLLNLYSEHAMALNTIAAASVMLSVLILAVLIIPQVLQHLSAYRKTKKSAKKRMEISDG